MTENDAKPLVDAICLKMLRTAVFSSTFANDWKFDECESPVAPGARELAEAIATKLRPRVVAVSAIEQHEYYGWAFATTTKDASFYNVLNPAEECYLTVSMDWYVLKTLLLRCPRLTFDSYCNVLSDALREIPEVTKIYWEDYQWG